MFVLFDSICWVLTYKFEAGPKYEAYSFTLYYAIQIILITLCYMLAVYTAGSVLLLMYTRHKFVFTSHYKEILARIALLSFATLEIFVALYFTVQWQVCVLTFGVFAQGYCRTLER